VRATLHYTLLSSFLVVNVVAAWAQYAPRNPRTLDQIQSALHPHGGCPPIVEIEECRMGVGGLKCVQVADGWKKKTPENDQLASGCQKEQQEQSTR
jgi:hypothetical protein